jgi:hypothetical protein
MEKLHGFFARKLAVDALAMVEQILARRKIIVHLARVKHMQCCERRIYIRKADLGP